MIAVPSPLLRPTTSLRRSAIAAIALLLVCVPHALAQRGQFDKSPLNPADEAYIFTPEGFQRPGKPAKADGSDAAKLHVTIVDATTLEPTLCRVNIVGSDGNYYRPADNPLADYSLTGTWPDTLAGNRPSKAPIRYFGHFFYTRGAFTVRVPPGTTRVEVWKGFEHRPETRQIELAAGATGDIKLSLTHAAPMTERGWYSGDPHLHFARTGDRDEQTIFDLLAAEDIRFGMILAYNETNAYPGLMPELITPQLRGLGAGSVRERGGYRIISGQEYRNVVFGHMLLLLRDSLVLEGQQLDPNLGPVFGRIGAETQAQGGYAFHAHGGYAQEIWADLVQQATNGVELLQFGIYRGIGLDGWYHVLNAGFRFPGIGASDYPACRKLGDCRTYAYIAGEPDFPSWLAAAAAGRSFMTTGPLVLLEVDGHRPGDILELDGDGPRNVRVHVDVRSEVCPVTEVQLVVNGQVVKQLPSRPVPGESQHLVLDETIALDASSWIAARAFSQAPSGSPDGEAHTNPVYVYRNGRRPYAAESVDWLIARLDEQIADHQARDVAEKAEPVAYFGRSREILRSIKEQGGLKADESPGADAPDATSAAPTDLEASETADLSEILKPVPPKSPSEALQAFEVADGFRMELVAHEPDVVDPVAACFDENGGMYVAEMIDYPYRPQGEGPLGRVRYLEDTDGDGRYDRSTKFAEGLAWPTGVVCWKGGVYVAAAPDIWYCRDTDGDRVADERERVYTGFGDRNQQGGVNNLNWGVDHHIYGSGSTNGGEIRSAANDAAQPISLSGHDFRFDPASGRFETITGRRQFGNAFDDWFRRFLCSESQPLNHEVLPQHYLRRNPLVAVPSGIESLTPGVTPIFRASPIEKWREIRSSRRLAAGERSSSSAGLSHNVMDAAAGLAVYRGHAYPSEYLGQVFVGCSQNNLLHRRTLAPSGVTFQSARADRNTEFVRSTDTWFRPVNCVHAPDGTLYVLDMSREVIESIHIAHDVVAHLDLTSGRDRGRIYRLAPPGFEPRKPPRLGQATSAELVEHLEHRGGWWRDTASRLLFERQDRSVIDQLRNRLRTSPFDVGRLHILWALEGLAALSEDDLAVALADESPGVREHAVRLAAARQNPSTKIVEQVLALAGDDEPRVRFEVAFALGEFDDPRRVPALAAIATRDAADHWMRSAVLSSSLEISDRLLAELTASDTFLKQPAAETWLQEIAAIAGARDKPEELHGALDVAAGLPASSSAQQAIVMGLGSGLARTGKTLHAVKADASAASAGMLAELFERAGTTVGDSTADPNLRIRAARLLALSGDPQTVELLVPLVDPSEPESLQLFALQMLRGFAAPEIADHLVSVWQQSTPAVQLAIVEALASRTAWAAKLLEACATDRIGMAQVPASTRSALVNYDDPQIRTRAEQVFGTSGPRSTVVEAYQAALSLIASAERGRQVYQRECTACHRLGEEGHEVGPNLALVRNRTDRAMLEAILDPNREVQPRYVNYVVVDTSGRTLTGLISAETASGLTLARDKGASETVLRQDIDQIKSTGKSLMPEGLEKTIDLQAMADLLAFLATVRYDVGTLPDFAQPEE